MNSKQDSKKSNKIISPESFPVELNTLELPLFQFDYYKGNYKSEWEWKEFFRKEAKKEGKSLEEIEISFKKPEVVVEEVTYEWIDSTTGHKKLTITSSKRLPRRFEQDVYYALLSLFIKKNAPFMWDEKKEEYQINTDKVYFSLYEVCKHLDVPVTGKYLGMIKTAIGILWSAEYTSHLSFKNKFKNEDIESEKPIKLLFDYSRFQSSKSDTKEIKEDQCWVQFSSIIIDNLKKEYFKYLNLNKFVEFSSGLERRLFTYLEKNSYEMKYGKHVRRPYVKRYLSTLKNKIPLPKKDSKSVIKKKLIRALDSMLKKEYFKAYFIDDKKDMLYICFSTTPEEVVRLESLKDGVKDPKKENPSKLDIPYIIDLNADFIKELTDRGISLEEAEKILENNEKITIIKYIVYIDKYFNTLKVDKKGSLLYKAITKKTDVKDKDILEYVNNIKKQKEKVINLDEYNQLYNQFIESEIEAIKCKQNEKYDICIEERFIVLNFEIDEKEDDLENRLKTSENIEVSKEEIDEINSELKQINEFRKKGRTSRLFKEELKKKIIEEFQLPTLEEYINSGGNANKDDKHISANNEVAADSLEDIDNNILDIIKIKLKSQDRETSYKTWILPLERYEIILNSLVIYAPNDFTKGHLIKMYQDKIYKIATTVDKTIKKVEFEVEVDE